MNTKERLQHSLGLGLFRTVTLYERLRHGATFDPTRRQHEVDPYPAYQRLRERDPVHRSPLIPGYVLSRYDDVLAVLRDGRYSADERNWKRWQRVVRKQRRAGLPDPYSEELASMLRMDPPDHTRLRTLVSKAFTPRAVERMRPRVQALVKELLGRADVGPMELVRDFAAPLPVMIIAEMLGVPSEDHQRFRHWSDEIVRTLGEGTVEDARRSMAAREELQEYMGGIVAARRQQPRDDLISGLVAAEEAGDHLSTPELFGTVLLLLVAGNETTTNLIANGVIALLRHPQQLAVLREEPARIPNAVEEILRYDSPVQLTSRIAREPGEIHGRRVRKGEQLVLLLGSGNRDEAVFERAAEFDVTRESPRHLSFSQGIHFCLGAQLARLEAAEALSGLLERFSRIEFAETEIDWGDNSVLRGPRRVDLSVG